VTVQPETNYAGTEEGYVGFQVFGRDDFDVMFIGNWASNVEVMWEHPDLARYLQRLGSFARSSVSTSAAPACPIRSRWAHSPRWSSGWTTPGWSWPPPAASERP
jgi:hypothetical protein